VPQAFITLNLLRASRFHPQLSALAALNGNFDFNRTPLAPPGIRVLVHEKPAQRDSWSPHGVDGWYTAGPALDSYRCYTVWVWATRATRICDTLSWFPTKGPMPMSVSFADDVSDDVPFLDHVALHGNAVNPDTGNIAEYAELSKCSQGHLWRNSNAEAIGRLAQGYKDIKGTNTMFFIRPIPNSQRPQVNVFARRLRVSPRKR
jgi:hypothetical protein